MYGKRRRLSRIFKNGYAFIAALDHGISMGFPPGLEDLVGVVSLLSDYVDAVIVNKGIIRNLDDRVVSRIGIIFKLNGVTELTENPHDLRLIGSVEEALSYDADAVSYEMYIGGPQEYRQIEEVSMVIADALKWDVPVILHVYPHDDKRLDLTPHCIRLGWELGADVVKTYYHPSIKKFIKYVPVPVVAAGGPRMASPEDVLNYVKEALVSNMRGVALGRNLWGWDRDTVRNLAQSIRALIDQLRMG